MIHAQYLRQTPRHFLIATALLLGFLALWPWIAPAPAALPVTVAADTGELKPSAPALPPAASLAAIAERPLFSPSRRPRPAGPAVVGSGGADRYRLVGLVSVGNTRRALVADGSRRIEINEGSVLDRWTVTRIDADRVLLSSPQGNAVLTLQRAAPDTSPPRPH